MSTNNIYVTKTQHYLKVKKPLIERQRRARMNKCLTSLKSLIAELKHDDAIMRMDKAEMLESTIAFMRTSQGITTSAPAKVSMNSFRNGYMNAVNEISRVMASMPGMSVQIGTAVMTHLGREFNRLLQSNSMAKSMACAAPMSPASSGYHSDCDDNNVSPVKSCTVSSTAVWRPW